MDSMVNLSRNVLQRIGAVNARLLGILRVAYEQLVALLTWPLMRDRRVNCLQILPTAVSPLYDMDEREQDEPEDQYANMRREAAIAEQLLWAAIKAWKQSEKNLSDALLAGKRLTFSVPDEIRDLQIANNAAEDAMLDAISDRTKLHMQHCEECERIFDARCTTVQVVARKDSNEQFALEVKESPRKLLAITYGDDTANEEIPNTLSRCDLLPLPAPEVLQKVIELPPCQVEKKTIKRKTCSLKKRSSEPKPKPRWR